MYTNNKLAKSIRLALMFGGASLAMSGVAAAQDQQANEDQAEQAQERIQVTGSRIKRTDMEGASPVEVISAEDFEEQGRVSVAEALQTITSNSFGSFIPSSGSSAQSQATVSLLGAGADRTLILIDGKRMAGSPSLGGSAVNLNSIPMAAIERIEVLKDGASAIYGSDAIAGVINIILKDDYEGASVSLSIGRPEADGADTKQLSFTTGVSNSQGSITFVYDHQERGAIFDSQRSYTAASMEDLNGDGVISIYDETVGISFYGATLENPNTGGLAASAICDDLTANVDGFVGVLDQGSALGGIGGGTVCGFAYANVSANNASTNRDAIMTSANYYINNDVELYARGMFSRNDSFGRYAPPAAPYPDIPADSPHNPFGEPVDGYWRWTGIGARDGEVSDYQQDYLIGLRGTLDNGAEWDVSYHKAILDYRQVGRYYLSYAGLAYNNLYGIDLGSEQGINNMRATTYTEDQNEFDHVSGGIAFDAGELPGGLIQHYVGAEYFQQDYDSKYDAQSEAGLIGGSAGNSAAGTRDTRAYFYEVALPFTAELTVSGAYRYDNYSDFGGKGTPSIKAEYRPHQDWLFRASYSEGFRAPSLSELLSETSFSATFATDYVACRDQGIAASECPSRQFDNLIESNPNLGPEESTYMNVGFVYSGIENFTARIDYFDLEVENVISSITVQSLINAEFGGLLDELEAQYPGVNLDRGPSGKVVGDVITRSANGGILTRQGLDVDFTYNFETDFGRFNLKSITTYLLEAGGDVYFGGPMQDFTGAPGTPDWRSQFVINYNWGDFSANWTTDAIASTAEDSYLDTSSGDPDQFRYIFENHNGTYVTHNLNLNLSTGYGRFTLGARNLFDKGVIYDDEGFWVDDTLYNSGHIGREFYFSYTLNF
ncbi:TonB-dependent receptor plug domain-containing protein [Pseudidiomarina insulisalsae]|uniref:TonB-dependent receptor n=1 Tax=Pseudidiomarina insulisalsae TaxID=575789 RepID=A0A432YLG6_9GAMM|nr:TonB-dependent receptor [Pseudidiomarina insulisalsae]RUO61829.1 TonB-dependent receptor [Pseudidiomarina insulisalsae]